MDHRFHKQICIASEQDWTIKRSSWVLGHGSIHLELTKRLRKLLYTNLENIRQNLKVWTWEKTWYDLAVQIRNERYWASDSLDW